MNLEAKTLPGGVGAEITGLDLSRPIDDATAEALNAAWLESAILVFRRMGTSMDAHLRLSRAFGELEVHPIPSIRLEGHDEIIELANRGETEQMVYRFDGERIAGRIPWHTDMIYTPTPNRGALLRMVETPTSGGETGWIDTALAYDALGDEMKERIAGLEGRFDFVKDLREMRFGKIWDIELETFGNIEFPEFPDVAHPLVWTHPISGRKSLSVSTVQLIDMVGMSRDEGDPILDELVSHTLDGRFTYVHEWEVGDMVLWDNWRTMHTALGISPSDTRVVHRTTMPGGHQMGRLL